MLISGQTKLQRPRPMSILAPRSAQRPISLSPRGYGAGGHHGWGVLAIVPYCDAGAEKISEMVRMLTLAISSKILEPTLNNM